jgi:hypothetical protein
VIRAILLDPELLRGQRVRRARNATPGSYRVEVRSRGTEFSRLREPINRVAALIRAMEPTSRDLQHSDEQNMWFVINGPSIQTDVGQLPYRAPTVFNYYLPDYQSTDLTDYRASRRLPTGLVATPEFEILNAVTGVRTLDRFKAWSRARWTQYGINHGSNNASADNYNPAGRRTYRLTFDLASEIAQANQVGSGSNHNDYDNPAHNKNNMKDLLEHFDLLLCNGSMQESTKRIIYEALATTGGNNPNGTKRVEEMLLAIVTSPDCAVEE